jgi:hypothetical protein
MREALRSERSLSTFLPFAQRVARLGIENSLAQTVGKLTAPGVPDIYQGCELWDLSLVDPDNRRPVDFAQREADMVDLGCRLEVAEQRLALFNALTNQWRDGRVKLATIALLLALRRDESQIFSVGDYQPIVIEGDQSDWIFGYLRAFGERRLAVLIARYPAHREAEPEWSAVAHLPEGQWFDLVRARYAVPAPRFESGSIPCPSRCCWPTRNSPCSLGQLATHLLWDTLEQKHGARGCLIDSSDVELACGQLRVCGVKETSPPLGFIGRRQGEVDDLVVGVEDEQQRGVGASPLDSGRLPAPVQQHRSSAGCSWPRSAG